MQEINNLQTIQTNHQQFINQLDQSIEYNKGKNTAEYKPNTSNTIDVELRKAETYYDWLKESFNQTTQTIEKGNKYVESLVLHKEKVQTELVQQNKNLEETKNKLKEIGEKVCEIAKQDADGKIKKLEEERQREWNRIAKEYDDKMKRVNDEYEEKINGIKKQIMEANEYAKMIEINQIVFLHERNKLEEWCGKKSSVI